jgi:predicted DNA-binding ribbon-helix-helix protein
MRSLIKKRSVIVGGHKTSLSLEDAFWDALKMIAGEREITLSELVSSIDASCDHGNLSSALRLFVLGYYTRGADQNPRPAPGRNAKGRIAYSG